MAVNEPSGLVRAALMHLERATRLGVPRAELLQEARLNHARPGLGLAWCCQGPSDGRSFALISQSMIAEGSGASDSELTEPRLGSGFATSRGRAGALSPAAGTAWFATDDSVGGRFTRACGATPSPGEAKAVDLGRSGGSGFACVIGGIAGDSTVLSPDGGTGAPPGTDAAGSELTG
jgi:hypothetical protein